MVNKRLVKKGLAVVLTLAMTLGMTNFGVVTGDLNKGNVSVQAEEVAVTEPTYNAKNDNLLYYAQSASNKVQPGVSLDLGTKFKISFNVKTTAENEQVWINLGQEAKGARVLLQCSSEKQGDNRYAITNVGEADVWNGANPKLKSEAGVNVTAISDGNNVSIWINGVQVKDNDTVREEKKSEKNEPACSSTSATFSNVAIWTENKSDEVKYDSNSDTSLKTIESEKIETAKTVQYASNVPAGRAYGMTFCVKTSKDMWITYGDDEKDRFLLSYIQYHTTGLDNNEAYKYVQFNPHRYMTDVSERVTLWVENNKLSVWENGKKIISEEAVANKDISALLKVYYGGEAEISNLQAWYKGQPPKSDEPEYNAEDDILLYENDTLTVANETTEKISSVNVSENDTYYISYILKTQETAYFTYRGTKIGEQAQVLVTPTQYGIIGLAEAKYPQVAGVAKKEAGMKVTIVSKPDASTVYVDGEKVANNAPLKDAAKNKAGNPSIYASGADVTVEAIKIWKKSDEPKFDIEKDLSKFYSENMTISSSKKSYGISIPKDTPYYATFKIKTEGTAYFSLRGEEAESPQFIIDKTQYATRNIEKEDEWKMTPTNVENGARVSIYCAKDSVTIWLDGKKIIDNKKFEKNADLRAKPGFYWIEGDATVTDARVWIKQGMPETDEPRYSEDVNELKASVDETVVESNKAYKFGASIPRYQDYCMDLNLKSEGGVYVTFRGTDKQFYMDDSQYAVIDGTGGDYIKADTKLSEGTQLTIKSTTKAVSIWLNKECIVDEMEISGEGQIGEPQISWTIKETTVKNLKVWTNKETFSHKFEWANDNKSAKVVVTNDTTQAVYNYDAVVTVKVISEATCTTNGVTRYTATFGGFSDSKDIEINAKGHKYSAKFVWAENGKSANVVVTCVNDSKDVKTYSATITSAVASPATYFEAGKTVYKAVYGSYSETKTVTDIPKLTLGKTKKVTVKSSKKKQLKVSLKAVSGAKKYQIQYSLKKNFKGAKTVTTSKKSYTIKKLKSKKKYYVRVRAMVQSGSNKSYGAWVKAKKAVKVK